MRNTWFCLFLFGVILTGCGEALPPLAPVKGKVTIDNVALKEGQVSLVAVNPDPAIKAPPSSGQIDPSGNYEIFTGGKPGAPLQKYKFVVTPPMIPGEKGEPFHMKYRDPAKTPHEFEVVASPAEGRYDLKLTK
jgi:hypothetical protein